MPHSSLLLLVLGGLAFALLHLLPSRSGLRDALVRRMGQRAYLAVYSMASLAALVAMIRGKSNSPYVALWGEWITLQSLAPSVMLISVIFAAYGLTTPSPTMVAPGAPVEPKGILRVTRHPFLVGVTLWALVHLLMNGEVGAVVLFGTFFLVAVMGTVNIDRKRAQSMGDNWVAYAEQTSIFPFLAIVQGRNHFSIRELATWQGLLAIAVYAAIFAGHAAAFGVPPLPG